MDKREIFVNVRFNEEEYAIAMQNLEAMRSMLAPGIHLAMSDMVRSLCLARGRKQVKQRETRCNRKSA